MTECWLIEYRQLDDDEIPWANWKEIHAEFWMVHMQGMKFNIIFDRSQNQNKFVRPFVFAHIFYGLFFATFFGFKFLYYSF